MTNRSLWQFNLSFIDKPDPFDIPQGGGTPAMPGFNGAAILPDRSDRAHDYSFENCLD
jgi:hypothetical protein